MRRLIHIALVTSVVGCAGAGAGREDSPELQGKPPTPQNDPFFYAAKPPATSRAEASGTIGEPDPPPAVPPPARQTPELDLDDADVDGLREQLALAEAERDAARARLAELEAEKRQSAKQPEQVARQCFSCVKLCPESGSCPRGADVVCGWGDGAETNDAKRRATAECDAALEQLRQRGEWSRITGSCPVATCD